VGDLGTVFGGVGCVSMGLTYVQGSEPTRQLVEC